MAIRNNGHRDLTPAYWLSGLLVVVTFVHSAIGALFPGIFRDPAMTAGNAQGTAIVSLTIAIPVLVISMIRAAQGSYRAQIIWLGALGYILYNAAIFAFAVAFNPLFLLYVASLSLSLWAIVALLIHMDVGEIRARFASNLPVRFFAIYVLVASALFFFTWMRQIIPAMFVPTKPAFLHGTDLLTSPTHVLDLGFALPLSVLGAVWLWQRKSWGYLLVGMMLSMLAIETWSITVDQVFGHLSDPAASLDAVPLFAVLTVIGLAVAIAYLRHLRTASRQRVDLSLSQ
ncbi:MAG: hypothetical protein RMN52_03885 [Anaerolineae bacterium]|nr:hypothetical protein [Candidatus Roseilinea sp.]MDW8449122.1 hypothetical protein [Anaerolineae bacterium]